MAQITVDERSVQWRAAVGRVRQAVGVTFYADIAELLYNDSHPDRFADLSNKVWTKHVRYVTEELTRSERNLSDAKMAMYAKPILAVCRDQTETRDEFLEYMKILFATPEKSRDAKLRQREEQAKCRLDAIRGARLRAELTKPNLVGIVSQDGGEESYDFGEGWRAAYADADDRVDDGVQGRRRARRSPGDTNTARPPNAP